MSSRTCGFISVFLIIFLTACNATSLHPAKAKLGQPSAYEMMLSVADKPGSITFHKHLAATWAVDRAGVINMQHPKAIAAGVQAGEEPIDLYVYTITHPEFGTFLIDSGISERFRNPADNSDISLIVKSAMNTDELKVVETTRALAAEIPAGIKGVFLTHIHLDHILGLSDLPAETPVYLGAGDATMSSFLNVFTQGSTDRLLGKGARLLEWQYPREGGDGPEVIDIFGDGSLWAIHVPGHTPGSTAYLVRSTSGPQLLTGDACHTRWGWNNGVEPGTFSENLEQSAASLNALELLAKQFPEIKVHPGHQPL